MPVRPSMRRIDGQSDFGGNMARKPTANEFQEHERTYHAFLSLTKLSIIAMIFVIVALYAIIFGGQPWLGVFLIVISVPSAIVINRATSAGD